MLYFTGAFFFSCFTGFFNKIKCNGLAQLRELTDIFQRILPHPGRTFFRRPGGFRFRNFCNFEPEIIIFLFRYPPGLKKTGGNYAGNVVQPEYFSVLIQPVDGFEVDPGDSSKIFNQAGCFVGHSRMVSFFTHDEYCIGDGRWILKQGTV